MFFLLFGTTLNELRLNVCRFMGENNWVLTFGAFIVQFVGLIRVPDSKEKSL